MAVHINIPQGVSLIVLTRSAVFSGTSTQKLRLLLRGNVRIVDDTVDGAVEVTEALIAEIGYISLAVVDFRIGLSYDFDRLNPSIILVHSEAWIHRLLPSKCRAADLISLLSKPEGKTLEFKRDST